MKLGKCPRCSSPLLTPRLPRRSLCHAVRRYRDWEVFPSLDNLSLKPLRHSLKQTAASMGISERTLKEWCNKGWVKNAAWVTAEIKGRRGRRDQWVILGRGPN